jgi:hypothetical protein
MALASASKFVNYLNTRIFSNQIYLVESLENTQEGLDIDDVDAIRINNGMAT